MSEYGELHIIPQFCEHAEARIIGNRIGLERLAAAISAALSQTDEVLSDHVFVNDGEGYQVLVQCVDAVGPDVPKPYESNAVTRALGYWQERAFEAEGRAYSLKRAASKAASKD